MGSDRSWLLEGGKSYRQLHEEGVISDAQLRSVILLFLACTGTLEFDGKENLAFHAGKLRDWGLDEQGNRVRHDA